MKTVSTLIIGFGRIGRELYRRILAEGWQVKYIVNSGGVHSIDKSEALIHVSKCTWPAYDLEKINLSDISVAFVALPPSYKGKVAREYISFLCRKRIPIVTCEKSCLAYHGCYVHSLGCTAAVGGGTQLLPFLERRVVGRNDVLVHIVLNATLNYVFDGPLSIEGMIHEAEKMHNTEPSDSSDVIKSLQAEIQDCVLKTLIIGRRCFIRRYPSTEEENCLCPDSVQLSSFGSEQIENLRKEKDKRRFIVSFSKNTSLEDAIGGFRHEIGNGWIVSAGFKRIDTDPAYSELVPRGAQNAVLCIEGKGGEDGRYRLHGPGAGPGPTASAMIQDSRMILGLC